MELVMTCQACPEQYDVIGEDGEVVGYLRLRWGHFSAHAYGPGGPVVYTAQPDGDGVFEYYERDKYLTAAKEAIRAYIEN